MATKKLRNAKQSMQFAVQEALEIGKVLKTLHEIFNKQHEKNLTLIKSRKAPVREVEIKLSSYELGRVLGALRDYATLRIGNIFDSHPAANSLKNFEMFNLDGARKIPEVKDILEARDNWIGHINKRFIGPVPIEKIYSKEIIALLQELQYFIFVAKEKP